MTELADLPRTYRGDPGRAVETPGRRSTRHRPADRRRDRVRDHGQPALTERRRAAAARERRRHGRRLDRPDLDLRVDLRRPLQPHRHPRRSGRRHDQQPRHRSVRGRPDRRRLPRRHGRQLMSTFRPSSGRRPHGRPVRCGCQRSSRPSGCCSSSTAAFAPAAPVSWRLPRAVDRWGLLLHELDQLRQPGRDDRPHPVGHVRRHRPGVGSDVHRHAAHRRRHRRAGRRPARGRRRQRRTARTRSPRHVGRSPRDRRRHRRRAQLPDRPRGAQRRRRHRRRRRPRSRAVRRDHRRHRAAPRPWPAA